MATDREIEGPVEKRERFFRPGPMAVLISFSLSISGHVFTDLIVYRTCSVSLNNNANDCIILRTNASNPEAVDLEARVEPYASIILMIKSLMDSLLPGLLSLFLGPWSDRGGRKPLLMAALLGFTITYSLLSLIGHWNISPWYLLVTWIPANISGGLCTIFLATICLISDTTTEKYRMRQLALLDVSILVGDVLGSLIGPVVYVKFGYNYVFGLSAFSCALALMYLYFFIPESVKDTSRASLGGLFKISLVKELITSSSVRRVDFRRSIVWLGISIFTLNAMIVRGHATILFLFTRVRLGWDVSHFSYNTATGTVLRITGLWTISLLGPILGISDNFLAGVGLASILGGSIIKSLSWKSWHMYLSVCIEIFSGIVGPVMRSIISKSVPAQDVGKVLSLSAFLEASSPLVGAPLYTLIYSHYLPPIFPSPVFLLSACFCILSTIFIIFMSILLKESHQIPVNYIAASQDDGCDQNLD